ncbi:MAG: 4Fe-4S dicluster domain-containing protein [Pseudomonadota bacterium]
MTRWGMVIDLKKCIGCYSCMITCKQEHFLPPNIFWSRLVIRETGEYPQVSKQAYPVLCNQCKDAACVKACPSGATSQREDGIIVIDSHKCAGCRYCVISCPYQQRTYYSDGEREYFMGQGLTELEIIGRKLYPLQPGTVVKCNFCVERIEEGIRKGLKPGVHRDASPACVSNCPVRARIFGDLNDPNSNVTVLIRQKKGVQFHSEFDTDPSVYYIH